METALKRKRKSANEIGKEIGKEEIGKEIGKEEIATHKRRKNVVHVSKILP